MIHRVTSFIDLCCLTCRVMFMTRRLIFVTRRFIFVTRRLVFVTRRLVFVTCRFVFVTHRFVFVARRFVFVTRRLVFATRRVQKCSYVKFSKSLSSFHQVRNQQESSHHNRYIYATLEYSHPHGSKTLCIVQKSMSFFNR